MEHNPDIQPEQPAPEAPVTSQIPTPPSPGATPPKQEKPQLSRLRRFFRNLLIGLVVLGITFLAGIVTDHYLRYQPLSEAFLETQATLNQANQKINDLQAQIGQLNTLLKESNDKAISLKSETTALQDESEMAKAHLELLQTLVDVRNAQLALFQDDVEGAKTALVSTQQRLNNLLPRIPEFDANLAQSLPQRLSLIVSGLDRDTDTAKIDLELFAKDLLAVEVMMFGS